MAKQPVTEHAAAKQPVAPEEADADAAPAIPRAGATPDVDTVVESEDEDEDLENVFG